VAYFAIYNLLNVYLSEDLGYSDQSGGPDHQRRG
jgi:hypothetical protein